MSVRTSNRLPVLAEEIKRAHTGVMDAAKTAAERAIEAGNALIEAKALVKHGEWLPFLRDHCEIPERTAQLYMKIARLELEPATVADLGIRMLSNAIVIKTPDYDPFAGCDDETKREWLLYLRHGAPWTYVEWLLGRPFTSVAEWHGDEGAAFRKLYHMREPAQTFQRSWAKFLAEQGDVLLAELEAEFAGPEASAEALINTERKGVSGRRQTVLAQSRWMAIRRIPHRRHLHRQPGQADRPGAEGDQDHGLRSPARPDQPRHALPQARPGEGPELLVGPGQPRPPHDRPQDRREPVAGGGSRPVVGGLMVIPLPTWRRKG